MDSSFGGMLSAMLRARGLSAREFARAIGKPLSYGFINRVILDQQPPPLDDLERWADVLELVRSAQREQFIEEGCRAAMQPKIRQRYDALKAELADVRKRLPSGK
jgi:transcriptional regulator with XRE-family HTH domain